MWLKRSDAAGADVIEWTENYKWALTAGGLTGVVLLAGYLLVGLVSQAEAGVLLRSALGTIQFLCSSAVAGSATILALMLTLLGISQSHDETFSQAHYKRVTQIATMNVGVMIGAVFILMLLTVPITEAENTVWYSVIYYTVVGGSAVIGGLLIAVVLLLFGAIQGLIRVMAPPDEADESQTVNPYA